MNNHRIPNEFSRSDKLGPFTMPQAMVLGAGAMVYLLFLMTISNLILLVLIFIVIATITAGMMYVRVNKLPLYEFLIKYAVFSVSPRMLVFRSDNIRKLDMEDELIGFQERVIAKDTVKEIKKDNNKKEKKQNNNSAPTKKKSSAKKSAKKKSVKKKGGNN